MSDSPKDMPLWVYILAGVILAAALLWVGQTP
jgi:hypothetical protein